MLEARIGRTIDGRYEVTALIGHGGFGAVYRARHLALGGEVAIKFLQEAGVRSPDARARFKREAEVLGRLRHPGIVSAVDFGEHEGAPYLVMELVRGKALTRLLPRREPPRTMEKARIVSILAELLEVLDAAHWAGVVHRDLKPDNVMVLDTEPKHVKVLDFGLALVELPEGESRLTATHAVQGTPFYMSPEQCRGRDVGPPTDVYAVGAILFECLTGEPPFVQGEFAEILAQHLFVEVPPARERGVRQPVDPALEALARAALAKSAAARPTASELRASLLATLEGKDAHTLAAAAAAERVAVGGLSREERAIGGAPAHAAAVTMPDVSTPLILAEETPRVAMWRMPETRVEGLRPLLAMAGIALYSWDDDAPPPARIDDRATSAVVVAGDAQTSAARIAALRAAPEVAKLPALAIDVPAPGDVAALVRAGASDAVLASAPSDTIGPKLWRMIRRKR
jgi:serine/threonine-protein kinase